MTSLRPARSGGCACNVKFCAAATAAFSASGLEKLAVDAFQSLAVRVAAIFTLETNCLAWARKMRCCNWQKRMSVRPVRTALWPTERKIAANLPTQIFAARA